MPQTVYIETSVPSAYVTRRRDARSLYQRQESHLWWTEQRPKYASFISQEVLGELGAGVFPGQVDALRLLQGIPMVEINEEVLAIAEVYVHQKLSPAPAGRGDSLHLALASYHEIDFLLTWNIRHLANPNKAQHLVAVNRRLALMTPTILTPDMLWVEEP